jgi:hypothetical protein
VAQQLASNAAASAGLAQTAAAAASSSGLLHLLGRSSRAFATNSHDIFNIHKHAPDNNWNTDFDFTPANYKKVRAASAGTNMSMVTCRLLAGTVAALCSGGCSRIKLQLQQETAAGLVHQAAATCTRSSVAACMALAGIAMKLQQYRPLQQC